MATYSCEWKIFCENMPKSRLVLATFFIMIAIFEGHNLMIRVFLEEKSMDLFFYFLRKKLYPKIINVAAQRKIFVLIKTLW